MLYVGSSRSRLYDTITRHFQRWHRNKRFWKGLHGAGHDPGMTYPRAGHEVAILTTACGDHLHVEAAWIDELAPRDNLVKAPDGELEDAPF